MKTLLVVNSFKLQSNALLSHSICYKNNFLLPPRPTREEWPFCFMKKQDISFTKEKYIYKNHYLVVSWQACAYQNEKLFHREWCRRSLTLIVSSYLEKYITTKTTSCNNKENYLFIYYYLLVRFSEHRPALRECAWSGLRSHARCHPYPIPQPVKVGHSTGVYEPYFSRIVEKSFINDG